MPDSRISPHTNLFLIAYTRLYVLFMSIVFVATLYLPDSRISCLIDSFSMHVPVCTFFSFQSWLLRLYVPESRVSVQTNLFLIAYTRRYVLSISIDFVATITSLLYSQKDFLFVWRARRSQEDPEGAKRIQEEQGGAKEAFPLP